MVVFQCKMCGAPLDIETNSIIASCRFCGNTMTIPRLSDERKASLYNRAEEYRRGGEYDRAIALYEQIVMEEPTEAEAYWGLTMCKYGIEYVEDIKTQRWIPTCNRMQHSSIITDSDYLRAVELADNESAALYRQQAEEINGILQRIRSISTKESPYDVFICYKETDERGNRTPDSVVAQNIYNELTQLNYKVFFARITLESHLGESYEPYIFAALQSARVMVVIGTSPAYFQAVWVKNEWSRYLALIKGGARKTLIPIYRYMTIDELPEEFRHLQALDMEMLGFIQDLIRGIEKIIQFERRSPPSFIVPQTAIPERVAVMAVPEVQSILPPTEYIETLLRHAYAKLKNRDWASALEIFDRVLSFEPRLAKAYTGKLMAKRQVSAERELANCNEPLERSPLYAKAIKYADDDYRAVLESYNKLTRNRLEAKHKAQYKSVAVQFDKEEDNAKVFWSATKQQEQEKVNLVRFVIAAIILLVGAYIILAIIPYSSSPPRRRKAQRANEMQYVYFDSIVVDVSNGLTNHTNIGIAPVYADNNH